MFFKERSWQPTTSTPNSFISFCEVFISCPLPLARIWTSPFPDVKMVSFHDLFLLEKYNYLSCMKAWNHRAFQLSHSENGLATSSDLPPEWFALSASVYPTKPIGSNIRSPHSFSKALWNYLCNMLYHHGQHLPGKCKAPSLSLI